MKDVQGGDTVYILTLCKVIVILSSQETVSISSDYAFNIPAAISK